MSALTTLAQHIAERCHLGPSEARRVAMRLRRLGIRGHRLEIAACNRMLTDLENRQLADTERAFVRECERIGARAVISDPRGMCYHVVLPGLDPPRNTWGGADQGWGVTA